MSSKNAIEVTIEVIRDDCLLTNLLSESDSEIWRLAMRPDQTLHRIRTNNQCISSNYFKLRGYKTRRINEKIYWVESPSCSVCSFFSRISFVQITGSHSHGKARLEMSFLIPSKSHLKIIKDKMDEAHLSYTILSVKPFVHQELTERERVVLKEALEKGYFDTVGRMSLTELAHILGVSPPSLSETVRRGLKKTVSYYLYQV